LPREAGVQRRLPEGPVRDLARWRAGPQLPVPRPRAVLHAYPPGHAADGAAVPATPSTVGRDGDRRRAGRSRGRVPTVPVRERREVPVLSRRARTAMTSSPAEVAAEVQAFYERYPYPRPVDDLDGYRKQWQDL